MFSVFQGVNGLSQGIMGVLNLIFGMPLMVTVDLREKIAEERYK